MAVYIQTMSTQVFQSQPTSSIRKLLDHYPWNVALHLNPETPWLEEFSALNLGDRVLRRFQRELYGNDPQQQHGVFLLIPEVCSSGFWHYHGFGWIDSDKRSKLLMRYGPEWFQRSVHGFIQSGGCPLPRHLQITEELDLHKICPSGLFQPVGDLQEAVGYAQKNWIRDGKEELVLVSGHAIR